MAKTKVAILFGGKSSEHEISKMSAKSVMENIDKEKFEIISILISKDGKFDEEKLKQADVVFPCLHGVGGEDGSIQGYCETIGKPYVGCGIEASVLGLDKIAQKHIYQNLGLPIPSFSFFTKKEWEENRAEIIKKIQPPVFIKPANTGSSIGVTMVKSKNEVNKAVIEAFQYHDRIIVEEVLQNIRELEVSVLGEDELIISMPGEVIPAEGEEFYTYDAKYKLESRLIIPAKLSDSKIKEIQELAKKAYRALGCSGFARVDFFLEKPEGKIYLNEINTIPGFTSISMYPKLMEAAGISYKEALTKLINLAIK